MEKNKMTVLRKYFTTEEDARKAGAIVQYVSGILYEAGVILATVNGKELYVEDHTEEDKAN